MVNRGQVSKDQKMRLVDKLNNDTQIMAKRNEARVAELQTLGLGVAPQTIMNAQVQVLIDLVCAGEMQRARFELLVQQKINNVLNGDEIQQALEQVDTMKAQQAEFERQKKLAEEGRTESGLFVPESAAEVALVEQSKGEAAVDPGAVVKPIRIG